MLARPKIRGGFKDEKCRTSIFYRSGRSNSRGSGLGLFTPHSPRRCAPEFVKQSSRCTRAIRIGKDCFCGEEFLHSHRWTVADLSWRPERPAVPPLPPHHCSLVPPQHLLL